jgi:hypothetical protein
MIKKLLFFIILLPLAGCVSTNANNPPNELSGYNANNSSINVSDDPPPKWYTREDPEDFDYIIKNAEMSSNKEFAESKNLLISKILLANKIESNFMTNTDQQNVISAIRNSSSNDQLRNYQNNKMVNSIILGYSVVNQKSMKYSTGYINYIFLKKIKK